MINSALNTMSVADLVPKAATKQPESSRGDGAFSEALAGAHTVHDQRDAQASATNRDRGQVARSNDRPRVGNDDRGTTTREARDADRTERADAGDEATTSGEATTAAPTERTDRGEATEAVDGEATTDEAAPTEVLVEADTTTQATTVTAEQATTEGSATTAATVAVAAAPVVDLDAIIVPTTTAATQVATDAVDAAIRLAIDTDVAAKAAVETAATTTNQVAASTTAAATAETTVETTVAVDAPVVEATVDLDAGLAARSATQVRDTEGAETGDVEAGPTRPIASTPATTSGPSPVQLAAATFAADAAAATQVADAAVQAAAPTVQAVATAQVADVATGTDVDAGATQLVQATAVAASDTDAPVVDDTAPAVPTAKLGAATEVASDAPVDVEVVDADAPQVAQVARNVQGQAPTVAAAAQFQAQVQAKAAEAAAEEGGEAAAPAKVEGTSAQQPLNLTRTEAAPAGVRVREGLLGSGIQERMDHIAEQLATRLRMSHAAGGSSVQLSLKPRELGEVTVQMNVRDGVVAATVLVDRADTLRTLETNIEDLKRSLEDQGLSIQEFSVDVRGENGAGGANARAAADLRQGSSNTGSGASANVAGAANAIPGLSGDREVDPDELHDGNVSVLA